MSTPAPTRAAVVCDDRPAFRASVTSLLTTAGYEVAAQTTSYAELAACVLAHSARLAVVALPLTGLVGLPAVSALRAAAPGCEVVLLAPTDGLAEAAVRAGALALVQEDDLRALRALLLEAVLREPCSAVSA